MLLAISLAFSLLVVNAFWVGSGSHRWCRAAAAGALALVATAAGACGSAHSSPATTRAGGAPAAGTGSRSSTIPSGAFSDHTGVTSSSVRVGAVSTLSPEGLFEGALVGTEAYADSVNSTGGVNGRTVIVDAGDDGSSEAGNLGAMQNALSRDLALVGGYSLQGSLSGTLLATHPGMPDVAVVPDARTNALPNVYSPVPLGGWETGPLLYFGKKYPADVTAAGTLTVDTPSALAVRAGERRVMDKEGYRVVCDPTIPVGQADLTPEVVAMKHAGVRILFADQLPATDVSALLLGLQRQDFHPQVVLGGTGYAQALVAGPGAPAAEGALVDQDTSFYLGQDAALLPAVQRFDRWVAVAAPGFRPDLFTLYGWLGAELFCDALRNAGGDPSRGSLLSALSRTTRFSGDGIEAPADPAARTAGDCYLIGRVSGGDYHRLDDPPVTSGTNGYRCDGAYVPASAA